MDSAIKVGVVGVGKMGQLHLQKLLASPGAKVIGIHDTDLVRLSEVGAKYGVRAFASLPELLFEIDAVFIAASTSAHSHLGRQALEAGVHVFVEKPIASSVAEAEHLVRLAADKGLVLQVGLIERFRSLALARGVRLFPVRFIESHRLSPNLGREGNIDVVMDLMIHDLDLTLSLVREDPVSISAVGVEVLTSHVDLANVRLEFPGGAVANLTASRVSSKSMRKFRVFSTEAYASLDLVDNKVEVYTNRAGKIERVSVERPQLDPLADQCVSFLQCVTTGAAPEVSGLDGLRALRCAHQIRERIRERAGLVPPAGTQPREPSPWR